MALWPPSTQKPLRNPHERSLQRELLTRLSRELFLHVSSFLQHENVTRFCGRGGCGLFLSLVWAGVAGGLRGPRVQQC
eukprot:161754-Rhodomonas_salina.3